MDIDISQSWCIGDNLTDIKAGKDAGCHTMLLGKMRCEICNLMYNEGIKPEAIKPNLLKLPISLLKGA